MKTHNKKKSQRSNDLLPPISAFETTDHRMIEGEHPAMIDEETLLKDVSLDFGRSSGPGGQHRNRKATACTATHTSTDISGEGTERRRQSENRKMAISRLRRNLAVQLRRKINVISYKSSDLWENRRNGDKIAINPKHKDYPCILAECLDIILACNFDMSKSAETLQVSTSQLLKIISHDKSALTWLNDQRSNLSLKPLKT
ncbi:MAG: peptide chain release factor-like protein [Phycisphaerales bacterium]|jgi:hypothetical protein|nr:peptide chain release factor-like protein [Phycisphaerales bacterium]